MSSQSLDLIQVKENLEDWLEKSLLCRSCGKLPESLWSLPCDHVICETCTESSKGKKCVLCNLPVRGKSATGEELVFRDILEAAKELVHVLDIDIISIGQKVSSVNQKSPEAVKRGKHTKIKITTDGEEASSSKEQKLKKAEEVALPRKSPRRVVAQKKTDAKTEDSETNVVSSDEEVSQEARPKTLKSKGLNNEAVEANKVSTRDDKSCTPRKKLKKVEKDKEHGEIESPKAKIVKKTQAKSKPEIDPPEMLAGEKPKKAIKRKTVPKKSEGKTESKEDDEKLDESPSKKLKSDVEAVCSKKPDVEKKSPKKAKKTKALASLKKDMSKKKPISKLPANLEDSSTDVEEPFVDTRTEEEKVIDPKILEADKKINKKRMLSSLSRSKESTPDPAFGAVSKTVGKLQKVKSEKLKNAEDASFNGSEESKGSIASKPKATTDSLRVNKSLGRKLCVVATGLDDCHLVKLNRFASLFGAKISKTYAPDVTHVICKEDKFGYACRTVKYLKGLLNNNWIVSFNWVEECLKSNDLLDEDLFEILGSDKSTSQACVCKTSRLAKTKLFYNVDVFFYKKCSSAPTVKKDDLIEMAELGGANVLSSTPQVNSSIKRGKKLLVVCDPADESKYKDSISVSTFLSIITTFKLPAGF